ncbi:MAG: hypothetical protein IPK50_02030 [Fibrobacterota bacterium]|nr:hypothetical protein [Fibrobacterota bacterium]QQS05678.1 MAG: hypothetical protein IPK50_02030 [Fibrobacterota bacterium]
MQYVLKIGRVDDQGCLCSCEWLSFLGFAQHRSLNIVVCTRARVDDLRVIFAGLARVEFQKMIDADLGVASIVLSPISDEFWPCFRKVRCDDLGIYEIAYFFESDRLVAEVQVEDWDNFLIVQEGDWLGPMLSWMNKSTCPPAENFPDRMEILEKVEGGEWQLIS